MAEMIIRGERYDVAVHGRSPSPPLLLLHGFTGSAQNWQDHLPALGRSHRVITVDVLGHGRSASPSNPARYSMAQIAADLATILGELAVERTAVLGYSMGGRLALYTAVHYPHRISRLLLESASPGLPTAAERSARRRRDNILAARIERDGIAAFVDFWESLALWQSQQSLPPERRARLRRQRLQNNPTGLANSLRGMGTGVQPSLWSLLSALSLPTLLLAGELDEKFVKINRQMADSLLNPQLEIIPKAGHTVHLERPSRFRQHLLTFLNK